MISIKKYFVTLLLTSQLFPIASPARSSDKAFEIAKGERIIVEERAFSIVPPKKWEIHKNYPGLSLLMQIPFNRKLSYQRTIKVMTFKSPRYIDDITRREFEKVLVQKYSLASQSIKNYRVRNHKIGRAHV